MSLLSRRNILLGAAILAAAGLTAGAILAWGPQNNTARQAASEPAAQAVAGAAAPAFSVVDTTGATRTLAEFAGRTIVLEWTNKDCPYVRKHYNAGNMQALQRAATADGVVWLTVLSSAPGEQGHLDAAGANANIQATNAAPTALLLDPDGTMGRAYGAQTSPHMYIINGAGELVYQGAIDDRPSADPATLDGATNYVTAALADLDAGRPVATPQTIAYGCSVKYAS
ncbi:MAG: redoxin domain-containing protein [Alphaproteobacteria bacterium]|nr:redoxin domain-containing protein [Alphaproteobacteria bacterium]